MLWAVGHAVLLQCMCGSPDGASPRETQAQLNCQGIEEIRTAQGA